VHNTQRSCFLTDDKFNDAVEVGSCEPYFFLLVSLLTTGRKCLWLAVRGCQLWEQNNEEEGGVRCVGIERVTMWSLRGNAAKTEPTTEVSRMSNASM